jgi:excisionase family DNA binding protein
VGEERTEGAQNQKEYLTVGEVARFLGVHRNTVHHRIKNGRIRAHKVVESDREVYRIDADSLGLGRTSADVRTLDAQRTTAGEALARHITGRLEEVVHRYAQEVGEVREQLGVEKGHRERLEVENERLRAELEVERSKGFWSRLFGG